jgi:hypothetical protein
VSVCVAEEHLRTCMDRGDVVRRLMAIVLVLPAVLVSARPATAAQVEAWTEVHHDETFTATWPDDICGLRANTTTYTRKVEQIHLTSLGDGTFSYHDVAAVTYVSDYVDPALPDLFGRLTEVNHFVFHPGQTILATTTYHDFYGEIRIFYRYHLTAINGVPVVEREVNDVTGCP